MERKLATKSNLEDLQNLVDRDYLDRLIEDLAKQIPNLSVEDMDDKIKVIGFSNPRVLFYSMCVYFWRARFLLRGLSYSRFLV